MRERREHWETVYRTKGDRQVSWYRDHLDVSLRIITQVAVDRDSAIIDVGGGSSSLVDDLLERGFTDLTVLDISSAALERSKKRVGTKGNTVDWIASDITKAELPEARFDVWHDRAVFHFLTDPKERKKYVDLVRLSVKPGGHVIIATFGPAGPDRCSGLEVARYSPDELYAQFGNTFRIVERAEENHKTPFGTTQQFVYCHCQKLSQN